jgi:hypothetical protein
MPGYYGHRSRIKGQWHGFHGALWMIGLAVLAWQGWWWPGILILIGISTILESALTQPAPFEEGRPLKASAPAPPAQPAPFYPVPTVTVHPVDLLPSSCAQCGGPIRGHEVKWSGPKSAACPYCGSNISLKKN